VKTRVGRAVALATFALGAPLAAAGVTTGSAQGETLSGDPEIIVVGDMACAATSPYFKGGTGDATHCHQLRVAEAASSDPTIESVDALVALGDIQYDCGAPADYAASYTPSWGRFNSVVAPVVGNHEYNTGPGCPDSNSSAATSYFDYFGAAAHPETAGKYTYTLGSWLFVNLNSECGKPGAGGCGATSAQTKWLKGVLAANAASTAPRRCIAAVFHKPLYTANRLTPVATYRAWWKVLYSYGVDLVLNGHAHNYQRYPPLNPTTDEVDPRGPTEYVVGTGGVSLHGMKADAVPRPAATAKTFGYLRMDLLPTGWSAAFVDTRQANAVVDRSSGTCH